MRYIMKFGILYKDACDDMQARIKNSVVGPVKKIYLKDGEWLLQTDIRYIGGKTEYCTDVRHKEYIMINDRGTVIGVSRPEYAEDENPDKVGWPAFGVPKVDHAKLILEEKNYLLNMYNNQKYILRDIKGEEILSIAHKGISGGWILDDRHGFAPEILCGIFVFCRYMEQENELLIV